MSDSLLIVCPDCTALNRVPNLRLDQQPQCGQCHQSLFSGHPVRLTSGNFDRHIQKNGIPVLVDFWAPWCGPCRSMAPHFEQAAQLLEPRIRLAKLDTEAENALGSAYGIRSIPTLVLFKDGREIARQSGAMGLNHIVTWANRHAI